MAISLESKIKKEQVFKTVSVKDSAIDWEKSDIDISEIEDADDEIEAKKQAFVKERDCTKLCYKEDDKPTIFVFKHPKSLESSKIIADIQLKVAGLGAKKGKGNSPSDLWYELIDALLLGTAENFIDDYSNIMRDKNTKKVSNEIMAALAEQNIVAELAGALLAESNGRDNQKK